MFTAKMFSGPRTPRHVRLCGAFSRRLELCLGLLLFAALPPRSGAPRGASGPPSGVRRIPRPVWRRYRLSPTGTFRHYLQAEAT